MATARKLNSGSWRCQVYSHTEEVQQQDGFIKKKRIYKSFTCDIPGARGKRECERMAAEWAAEKDARSSSGSLTVREAIDLYISCKEGVLSAATIRGYRSMERTFYGSIGHRKLYDLDNPTIQRWIQEISAGRTPKTVRNAYGFLVASVRMSKPDFHPYINLPARVRPDLYVPSDSDVKALLDYIRGTELEIAVLLAAFGPMRRGEICALESADVNGCCVTINKSMVFAADNQWYIKPPKTYSGYRTIEFPPFVIERLSGISGRIVKATPQQITNRFARAIKFSGLPHFRFHDLRHYAASIMHAIGVPDQYIVARGGWATTEIMKSIYQGCITDEQKKQTKKIIKHFEIMQHEMQHGITKAP